MRDHAVRDFEESFRSTGIEFFEKVEPFARLNWYYDPATVDPKSMLVWNSGGIGDNLYMTAVVAAIKKLIPQCQIDVVCQTTHGLWNHNPDIRSVKWEFVPLETLNYYDAYFIVDEDVVKLVGAEQKNCYHKIFEMAGLPYSGEQPKITLSTLDEFQARNIVAGVVPGQHGDMSANYIVLGLHASTHTRDISKEQWVSIAQAIAEYGKEVNGFTIYSLAQNEHGHEIQKALSAVPGHIPIFGARLTIRQIAALIRTAFCVVSVDSMLVHLAAAVKAPCVGIYTTVPARARVATYPPFIAGLWAEQACPWSGCSWKHDGFSVQHADVSLTNLCYTPDRQFCSVGAAIKAGHVLNAMEVVMGAKRDYDQYQIPSLPVFIL